MHHAVILHHMLEGGASHFDWLIDRPDLTIEHRLISFRCARRPDFVGLPGFYAQRLPDHRARYLTYEGVISGDRGVVERVALGEVLGLEVAVKSMFIVIRWADRVVAYRGSLDGAQEGKWHFIAGEADSGLDG